jgi:hypothetical protein
VIALAHHLLCGGGIIPKFGILGSRVQFGQTALATSQSKMPPQQRNGLLDLIVQGI